MLGGPGIINSALGPFEKVLHPHCASELVEVLAVL